ncbi:hypothetical protein SADUNF_Sadunf12G0043200 [Salix dunnii]|uniref:Uncharacterized protein n=1 Tax=Salix dunnii TaxID=1413687 RepID=A0A835JKI4_9ROSI|nr:hypothetical protein SADUNF_Sadunf12G0043200 [Salix dunnii]
MENGNGSANLSQIQFFVNDSDADSQFVLQESKYQSLFLLLLSKVEQSVEANEESGSCSGRHADPNAVILDYKLCGASVGLWTISMVPQPLEGVVGNSASNGALSSMHRPLDLSEAIAWGPLPTKQNFKTTISLPVICWNIRARFSYGSDNRDCICDNQETTRSGNLQNRIFVNKFVSMMLWSPTNAVHGEGATDQLPENANSIELLGSAVGAFRGSQVSTSQVAWSDAIVPVGNGKGSESNSEMIISSINHDGQQTPGADISGTKIVACQIDMRKGQTCSVIQNSIGAQEKSQGTAYGVQVPVNSEVVAYSTGKDPKQLAFDKTLGFEAA